MSDFPYDSKNSTNPWLININKNEIIIGPENIPLTAEYIWSKEGIEREELLEWVFNYYRNLGFPDFTLTDKQLNNSLEKLKKFNEKNTFTDEVIKNSNSLGTDVLRHFTGKLFFSSTDIKRKSCREIFNDDLLFKKVLRNRMGWCASSEDGTMRPYVFGITNKMIISGMRNSGLAGMTSNFKPAVAKYIYSTFCKGNNILDYSAGWGARALAAISLGKNYYGIDPLTYKEVNNIFKYFKYENGFCIGGGSEEIDSYSKIPKADFAFSSPPYYNLEIYSKDENQSIIKFQKYEEWLVNYWRKTVSSVLTKLNGYFSFMTVDTLADDMIEECKKEGLTLIKIIKVKTAKSHLSKKIKTDNKSKTTEGLYIFE